MEKKHPSKRKHVRFPPEPNTTALIDYEVGGAPFTPSAVALVFSESYGGCGLIVLGPDKLKVGNVCRTKVGPLAPMRAEVVWRTQLDDQVAKVGMKYLD